MTVLPPATVMAGFGYESDANALGADRVSAAPARLTDTAVAASVRAPDRAAIACQRDLIVFTSFPLFLRPPALRRSVPISLRKSQASQPKYVKLNGCGSSGVMQCEEL